MFSAVIAIVEEAQERALQPLKDRRQVVEKEAEDIKNYLTEEIRRFQRIISELEDISPLEDHILFLQVRNKRWNVPQSKTLSYFEVLFLQYPLYSADATVAALFIENLSTTCVSFLFEFFVFLFCISFLRVSRLFPMWMLSETGQR